jgi:hypothetical protein
MFFSLSPETLHPGVGHSTPIAVETRQDQVDAQVAHDGREEPRDRQDDRMAKKMNCGCGCVPPGKTAKRKVKTESAKAPKKRK